MLLKAEERKGENMKLEDVLAITSEHTTVKVVNYVTQNIISFYDGKNSIDTELNNKEVVCQYVKGNELFVEILL